ncbi:hypothetical protein [Nonomuraea sp. NPDC005501]|uniref:hypothetical protein n=1 Tax=Nonomuraea sp. NPDC005501 TaxID=3156884 RepID=UPI0033B2B8AC
MSSYAGPACPVAVALVCVLAACSAPDPAATRRLTPVPAVVPEEAVSRPRSYGL